MFITTHHTSDPEKSFQQPTGLPWDLFTKKSTACHGQAQCYSILLAPFSSHLQSMGWSVNIRPETNRAADSLEQNTFFLFCFTPSFPHLCPVHAVLQWQMAELPLILFLQEQNIPRNYCLIYFQVVIFPVTFSCFTLFPLFIDNLLELKVKFRYGYLGSLYCERQMSCLPSQENQLLSLLHLAWPVKRSEFGKWHNFLKAYFFLSQMLNVIVFDCFC